MVKKVLLLSSVLFVFSWMSGECFADASAQLEQANTYKKNGYYQEAEEIYQDIVARYPGTSRALRAQKNLVILHILGGNGAGAQAAIDKLTADFSEHPLLPTTLYWVARRYKKVKKYKEAKDIYLQIIQQYPDSPYASKAQLGVQRTNVPTLIESGDYAKAEAAIDSLVVEFADFNDYPTLPAALRGIARRYEESRKYEEAKDIYLQIIQQYPDSQYASRAQLDVSKMNVLLLIESGKDSETQAAIDNLIADFSEHPDLPKALYRFAKKYEERGKYEEAKDIYLQIIQQYPDSQYASRAQLDVPKMNVLSLIRSGNYSTAQTATDRLIADFNDHSSLPRAVFQIGEEYYNKAFRHENEGLAARARDNFRKAVAVWERIIQELPASAIHTAHAYYFSAACHRELGEYGKSIECYQQVVANWPDYKYAWDALFRVGRNYEDLKESGLISKSEADTKIRAAYEQLLEKYPACAAAEVARSWLENK